MADLQDQSDAQATQGIRQPAPPPYQPVTTLRSPALAAMPRTTSLIATDAINQDLPPTKKETKAEEAALRQQFSYLNSQQRAYINSNNLTILPSGKPGHVEPLTADQQVSLKSWQQQLNKAIADKNDDARDIAQAQIDSIKPKETVDEGWLALENAKDAIKSQIDLLNSNESDLPDSKGGGGGGGAVDAATAYLKTETRKTNEVKRQFDDFMNRAQGYYGLVKDEQSLYNNASDQYSQDIANAKKNHMIPTASLPVQTSWGGGLSSIVRPSIPDYVLPDYRLNQAVGLPGKEGFDNPNYDENGTPKYAHGTQAPLGSGERFSKLSQAVGSDALAAWIGRKKYGDAKMQSMAAAGKKKTPKYANGTNEFASLLEQLKAENRVPVALWPKKEFSFEPRGISDQVMPNG